MSSYSTRQRKALLAYLSRHPDELLSARQIADALVDEKISLSAVYRNLAQLETEEKVRRSSKSGTREVYYQYLDAESCKGALHMSCVKCGRTFHMASGNAALFAKHLAQSEQFTLDAADEGRRISLYFEGVGVHCKVYVNGCYMLTNNCGYNSFEVDVTDVVDFGQENVVAIHINTLDWWDV